MKTLLALWRDRSKASTDVKSIAPKHVEELERKAAAIQAMAATLKHLVKHCQATTGPTARSSMSSPIRATKGPPPAINARFDLNGLKTEYDGR
jgi:hypothetical protein